MKKLARFGTLCTILVLASAVPAGAQSDTEGPIDPEALAAMDNMAAALRAMPAFAFDADVTTEQVLDSGQKLQFGGKLAIVLSKPDGFKIVADADAAHREYFYDGHSLTVFAPALGYYASVDAPPTIGRALEAARQNYGLELPLADLFIWDTDQTIRSRIESGYIVRPETISGRQCMHYAFRQENVDWQIWLQDGAQALPCKLVITNTEDPSMPQYSAVFSWKPESAVPRSTFAFSPPADAHRITLLSMSDARP